MNSPRWSLRNSDKFRIRLLIRRDLFPFHPKPFSIQIQHIVSQFGAMEQHNLHKIRMNYRCLQGTNLLRLCSWAREQIPDGPCQFNAFRRDVEMCQQSKSRAKVGVEERKQKWRLTKRLKCTHTTSKYMYMYLGKIWSSLTVLQTLQSRHFL